MSRLKDLMTSISFITKPATICEFIEKYQDEIDFNFKDDKGNTFLHTVVMGSYSENDKIKILYSLLYKCNFERTGIDVNAKNNNGFIALDYAAQKGDLIVINLLFQYGAQIAASKNMEKLIITVELAQRPHPDLKNCTPEFRTFHHEYHSKIIDITTEIFKRISNQIGYEQLEKLRQFAYENYDEIKNDPTRKNIQI